MGAGFSRKQEPAAAEMPPCRLRFLRHLAIETFQLDPEEAHLIQSQELFSEGENPSTEAEVAFCVWKRLFQKYGHDPPELFACTVADRHLCVARFQIFHALGSTSSSLQGLQNRRFEQVKRIQEPSGEEVLVADVVATDKDGGELRFRTCYECDFARQSFQDPPKHSDRLATISVTSTPASTQDESLQHLMKMFDDLLFLLPALSKGNVSQQRGFPSITLGGQPSLRPIPFLCLLVNSDTGDGCCELAWLARSFELGTGGYPPDGVCGAPFLNWKSQRSNPESPVMLGMYSCVVSDAPYKCHSGEPSKKPPENFMGFVKVEPLDLAMDSALLELDPTVDQPKEPQHDQHAETRVPGPTSDEFFSAKQPDFEDRAAKPQRAEAVEECGNIKLQRISNCLYHIGEVEVNVQKLRFTQNTISSRFRDGRLVRELAAELRSNPAKANELPKLQVFDHDGELYSLDNRRLFACKVAEIGHLLVEKVQVRRDLLNQRLTTTSSGRVVVFGDDAAIPWVVKFEVIMTECNGNHPDCTHHVKMEQSGSTESISKTLQATEIVKIQGKNRFPINDHFQDVFQQVMRSLAFPEVTAKGNAGRTATNATDGTGKAKGKGGGKSRKRR